MRAWRQRKVLSVPPLREDGLNCAARVEAIEQTVQAVEGPIIFVAHSGGVIMLLHWARKYRHAMKGALLVAPPDVATPLLAGRLPFASLVAASTNDPLASYASVEAMAHQWGSTLVNVGAVGYLNPASGFGEWPRAQQLLQQIDNGYCL